MTDTPTQEEIPELPIQEYLRLKKYQDKAREIYGRPTPAQKLGLAPGDAVRVVDVESHYYKAGSVHIFLVDDGTDSPWFSPLKAEEDRAFEKIAIYLGFLEKVELEDLAPPEVQGVEEPAK